MITATLIRLAKLIALFGFILPWFAISCSNQKLVEPRGYEIVLGAEVQPHEDLKAQAKALENLSTQTSDSPGKIEGNGEGWKAPIEVQALAAGAAVLLVLSLVVGFALKGQAFVALSAFAGFAAAGLAFATVAGVDGELKRRLATEGAGQSEAFAGIGATLIKVTYEPGLWVTVGASAAAGLVATFALLLAMQAGQQTPRAAPSEPPTPPQ